VSGPPTGDRPTIPAQESSAPHDKLSTFLRVAIVVTIAAVVIAAVAVVALVVHDEPSDPAPDDARPAGSAAPTTTPETSAPPTTTPPKATVATTASPPRRTSTPTEVVVDPYDLDIAGGRYVRLPCDGSYWTFLGATPASAPDTRSFIEQLLRRYPDSVYISTRGSGCAALNPNHYYAVTMGPSATRSEALEVCRQPDVGDDCYTKRVSDDPSDRDRTYQP
jgi:hypothetical protein